MEKMISIEELKERINLENSRFFIVKTERLDLENAKSIYVSNFSLNTPIEKISYVIQRWDMEARMSIFYFVQELQEESKTSLFGKFSYDNIAEHNLKDIIMLYDNMVNIIDNTTLSVYDLTHDEEEKLEEEKMISRRTLSINENELQFNSLLCITLSMTNPSKGFKSISSLIGRILGSRIGDDKNKPTWFVERLFSGVTNEGTYKYLVVIRVVQKEIITKYDNGVISKLPLHDFINISSEKYTFEIFPISYEEIMKSFVNITLDIKRMYTVYSEDAAPQFYNLIHLNIYADDEDSKLGIHKDDISMEIIDTMDSHDDGDATLLEIDRKEANLEETPNEKTESGERQDNKPVEPSEKDEVNKPAVNKGKVKVIMSNLTFVPGAQGLPQILMNEYITSINSYFEKLNISIPEVKFEVNNNSQYGYINIATGVSVTLINPELSVLALYDFMKIYNLTNVHFCKED